MADASPTSIETNAGKKLPPGMVLGPDGKPCKICTAFRYMKPPQGGQNQERKQKQGENAKIAAAMAAAAPGSGNTPDPDVRPEYCPPDVEILGRSTWAFLHTTAAYYPDRPSPTQRANMLNLLYALPVLYPCSHCASHLGEEMKVHPPDVSGRTALSRWLCERHNEVNERLGKERFDCAKTDERWKDGPSDGSCD
ncbi:FAD-dependent thiol oxidase [Gloeophyllum trabeum ATCC 11539]|uniref:Sulfhydryl oxidase n=1 Tax=Gloeophyllum trabeum (strain ATCC 11539 / FP-39264 / Madison 617) TaxID=670483 RepID=S7QBB0_GLOTA|nr:FAD-dependent thiol oxidase [Gloeophyllum trabeum ATCC 11539]EPQ56628.1 FAD-dependent thiol oxidase [Gloeophyllum trabeum ATCC 11539]